MRRRNHRRREYNGRRARSRKIFLISSAQQRQVYVASLAILLFSDDVRSTAHRTYGEISSHIGARTRKDLLERNPGVVVLEVIRECLTHVMILNGNGRQPDQSSKVRHLCLDQRGAGVLQLAQRLGDDALDFRVKPAEPVLPVDGEFVDREQ